MVLTDFEVQRKSTSTNILVAMFENNNFFPVFRNNNLEKYDITSSVVGVKIGKQKAIKTSHSFSCKYICICFYFLENQTLKNLTEPIQIMLRLPNYVRGDKTPVPVWWDQQSLSGRGSWSTEGCLLSYTNNELFIFTCDRLGYYALMQEPNTLHLNR